MKALWFVACAAESLRAAIDCFHSYQDGNIGWMWFAGIAGTGYIVAAVTALRAKAPWFA